MNYGDLSKFKPIPKPKPDALTYGVRFGCGFLFGIFFLFCCSARGVMRRIGYFEYANEPLTSQHTIWSFLSSISEVILIPAIIIGLLSAVFGDKFWDIIIGK